jgi:hypothetical protein
MAPPGRLPLAPRNGNVSAFPAQTAFDAKVFVSAHNLLQTSPLSTDAPAAPLQLGGTGEERTSHSWVINALYRSTQGGSDPSPVDPAGVAAAPFYNSELDFLHRDLLPTRARPQEASREWSAPSVPAPVAHLARAGPAAPAAPGVRASVDSGSQSRVQARTGNTERAVASLAQAAPVDDERSAGPVAAIIPPSWDDMLQMIADLPLPSNVAGAAEAALPAGTPSPTTVGLMVKPDPENHDRGVVTGFVEGSSADLSGEVMAGDVVLAVDGIPFNQADALKVMRGGRVTVSAGVQLRLTLERHGAVFECALTREPYSSVQLKHELFEALSRLKESLDALTLSGHKRIAHEPELNLLLEAVQDKLMDLEKSSLSSLRLLRSELQGLQDVMEQIVVHIHRATDDGGDVIRSLTECIAEQENHIEKLSAKVKELLGTSSGEVVPRHETQAAENHGSQDQLHLLRHECNRLRSSLQNKEFELEGLRESFNRKLEQHGLGDDAHDGSTGYRGLLPHAQGQCTGATEASQVQAPEAHDRTVEEELKIAQARLAQEGEASNMEIAALKRDLWVSVIRRWLNNCCRRIITCWRSELVRKQYFRVVCRRREQMLRSRHSRTLLKRSFSAFRLALFESKRLRHAGVTAASGWLFLGVRKHLHAWLARVDWKAYTQRLGSKCKARAAARVFHCWSRVAAKSAPGLDSDMVTAIMSTTSTGSISSRAARIMEDANLTLNCAQKVHVVAPKAAQSKPASVDKGMQSLKWESDASVQCALDVLRLQATVSQTTSCAQTEQALGPECHVATVSTASQSDAVEDLGYRHIVAAQHCGEGQKDQAFVFRCMQEKLDSEQRESRRLREKLSTALESVKRHEEFLKSAQDSDRRLKESMLVAHQQLHRSLRCAEEEKRRANQLGQELEQVERKLLMAQEERDELRTIVADERRKNARGTVGNSMLCRAANVASRPVPRQDNHGTSSPTKAIEATRKSALTSKGQSKSSVRI